MHKNTEYLISRVNEALENSKSCKPPQENSKVENNTNFCGLVNRLNAADSLSDYYLVVAKDRLASVERSLQRPVKNEKEYCSKLEFLRKNGLYYIESPDYTNDEKIQEPKIRLYPVPGLRKVIHSILVVRKKIKDQDFDDITQLC